MAVRPVTPISDIYCLSRDIADAAILNPLAANALEQGEFLIESSSGWTRISGTNAAAAALSARAEMVWSKKGEAPTQALKKVACFTNHDYIVETDMFDDALTPALGQALTVHAVTVGGVASRSAFTLAASGELVRATVQLPLPADNGGWLRVKVHSPYTAP
jgi:hypothetical protein